MTEVFNQRGSLENEHHPTVHDNFADAGAGYSGAPSVTFATDQVVGPAETGSSHKAANQMKLCIENTLVLSLLVRQAGR